VGNLRGLELSHQIHQINRGGDRGGAIYVFQLVLDHLAVPHLHAQLAVVLVFERRKEKVEQAGVALRRQPALLRPAAEVLVFKK